MLSPEIAVLTASWIFLNRWFVLTKITEPFEGGGGGGGGGTTFFWTVIVKLVESDALPSETAI